MHSLGLAHLKVKYRILRYLKGTPRYIISETMTSLKYLLMKIGLEVLTIRKLHLAIVLLLEELVIVDKI